MRSTATRTDRGRYYTSDPGRPLCVGHLTPAAAVATVVVVFPVPAAPAGAIVQNADTTGPDQEQQAPVVGLGHLGVGPYTVVLVLPPPVVRVVVVMVFGLVVLGLVAAVVRAGPPISAGPLDRVVARQPVLNRVHDDVRVHWTPVTKMLQQYASDQPGHATTTAVVFVVLGCVFDFGRHSRSHRLGDGVCACYSRVYRVKFSAGRPGNESVLKMHTTTVLR